MPTLWIPQDRQAAIQQAANEEQRQMRDEVESLAATLEHFNAELRRIDPHLSIVLAKPNTTVEGLKPGYYHIVRMRPGHPAYVKPIEGPGGEWRDLDSSVFDLVAQDDLWNDRVRREQRRMARRAEEARARQADREALDRAAEFDERWRSANSTSILIPKAVTPSALVIPQGA